MVKKALLIGINYKGSNIELNGCINDVKNMKDILIKHFDFKDENIRILTEESNLVPNKLTIMRSIKWLVFNCRPGDTLFFHYSGHGASIDDINKDETDGKDEVIIPLDYKSTGIISDDWLHINLIKSIPQGVKLWGNMDCCHSGTLFDLKYNWRSLSKIKDTNKSTSNQYKSEEWTTEFSFTYEKENEIDSDSFICMFSAAEDPQVAMDASINGNYTGAFTYCFIEFIKNNLITGPDGKMHFDNSKKISSILKEINSRLSLYGFKNQNCQLSLNNFEDFEKNFDL